MVRWGKSKTRFPPFSASCCFWTPTNKEEANTTLSKQKMHTKQWEKDRKRLTFLVSHFYFLSFLRLLLKNTFTKLLHFRSSPSIIGMSSSLRILALLFLKMLKFSNSFTPFVFQQTLCISSAAHSFNLSSLHFHSLLNKKEVRAITVKVDEFQNFRSISFEECFVSRDSN